jgi:hypothetical protein
MLSIDRVLFFRELTGRLTLPSPKERGRVALCFGLHTL